MDVLEEIEMALKDKILEMAERLVLLKQQRAEIDRNIDALTREYSELVGQVKRSLPSSRAAKLRQSERQSSEDSPREVIQAYLADGQVRHIDEIQTALPTIDRKTMLWTIYNLKKVNYLRSPRRGFWQKVADTDSDGNQQLKLS